MSWKPTEQDLEDLKEYRRLKDLLGTSEVLKEVRRLFTENTELIKKKAALITQIAHHASIRNRRRRRKS
jgi:hypothetical protein